MPHKRKFIQGILSKPGSKGALHRMLNIPEGEKIGKAKIAAAAEHPERFVKTKRAQILLKRRARFAQTLAKLR